MEHAEGSIVIDAPFVGCAASLHLHGSQVDVPVLGKATYTLSYRYAPGDTGLSWTTKEARGAIRDIRGEYLLNEISDSETKVTYRLAVEIGILVPGFVRTEGAKRVIENALERLKRRVEMG